MPCCAMCRGIERARDIDRWLESRFANDAVAAELAAHTAASGARDLAISANTGRLLRFLVEIIGARHALEVGTNVGYSGVWIAGGLPRDGRLVTIEKDPVAAAIAEQNFSRVSGGARIDVRVGDAAVALERIRDEGGEPFDFLFLDEHREDYLTHLGIAKPLLRSGALVVADNVIWGGDMLSDPDAPQARYLEAIHADPEFESIVLPMIRASYDGISISRWLPQATNVTDSGVECGLRRPERGALPGPGVDTKHKSAAMPSQP